MDPATPLTSPSSTLVDPAAGPQVDQPSGYNRSRWKLLLITLVTLVVLAWLTDAPARLGCLQAEWALQRNQPHQAIAWTERSLGWSRHRSEPLLLAVRAYLQLNKSQTAALFLEQAALHSASAQQVQAYRLMVAAQGGESQAIDQLLASQSELPLPPEAYEAVVRGLQVQNNLQRASLVLDELQRSGTVAASASYLRGRNCEIQDDLNGAIENYRQTLLVNAGSPRAAFRAGKCLVRLRRFEDAIAMFQVIQQATPYQSIVGIELANCWWEVGQLETAATLIEPTLAIDPRSLQSLYLELDEYMDNDRAALTAARIYDASGQSQRVVDLLERVLKYNHRDFEARTLSIKHLRLLKRQADADALAQVHNQMILNRQRCREIRLLLDAEPDNIELRCELAELYWETESEAEARLMLQEILELSPQNQRALELQRRMQIALPNEPTAVPDGT